jgi:hypothetical protein
VRGRAKGKRVGLMRFFRRRKLGLDQGWALGYKRESTFFLPKPFFGMPLREQGVPRTSGAKTMQGELIVGINPLIAY